jgi:hypothetical protein
MTENVIRTASLATDDEWQRGSNWYADAQSYIAGLSHATHTPADTVAGVVAALSPRVSWSRNLVAARAACEGADKPSGVLTESWDRAQGVLLGTVNPLDWPAKIGRFYRNLTGDPHAVTVDAWSWRVAAPGVPDARLYRAGVYEAVEAAYQHAGDRLEVTPADVQATTWLHIRHAVYAARARRYFHGE